MPSTPCRLALCLLLCVVPATLAQAPRYAIVAAAANSPSSSFFTDVQSQLLATASLCQVDIVSVAAIGGGVPELSTLLQYDAVLVWSNVDFADPDLLGDRLADYVDADGGVVVCVFANSTTNTSRQIGGRWKTGGYEVIPSGGGTTSSGGEQTLGRLLDPNHPILQDVDGFAGGASSFRPTTTALAPGSTSIAQWSDGKTLVAVGANPRRADLGFYPPSSNVAKGFWDASTAGGALMANALRYVTAPCGLDLTGDGIVNQLELNLLLAAFGACAGDPGFNSAVNFAPGPVEACAGREGIDQLDLNVLLSQFNCGICP